MAPVGDQSPRSSGGAWCLTRRHQAVHDLITGAPSASGSRRERRFGPRV